MAAILKEDPPALPPERPSRQRSSGSSRAAWRRRARRGFSRRAIWRSRSSLCRTTRTALRFATGGVGRADAALDACWACRRRHPGMPSLPVATVAEAGPWRRHVPTPRLANASVHALHELGRELKRAPRFRPTANSWRSCPTAMASSTSGSAGWAPGSFAISRRTFRRCLAADSSSASSVSPATDQRFGSTRETGSRRCSCPGRAARRGRSSPRAPTLPPGPRTAAASSTSTKANRDDPIYLADRTGADARQILGPGTLKNMNPVWSPDGQWIYFVRGDRSRRTRPQWTSGAFAPRADRRSG